MIRLANPNPTASPAPIASPTATPIPNPPTSVAVVINDNLPKTGSTSVSLTLSATNATEMYVTTVAGCTSGGAWETMATSKSFTLAGTNSSQNVYAKFRSASGDVSACVSDSIVHDSSVVFYDDFQTASLSAKNWSYSDSGSVISGGELLSTPPSTAGSGAWLQSQPYTPGGTTVTVEVTQGTNAGGEFGIYLFDQTTYAGYYLIVVNNAMYYAYESPTWSDVNEPYNPAVHRWFRIRQDLISGNTYWETSADNTIWTVRRTVSGLALSSTTVNHVAWLYTKNPTGTSTPGTAHFDHFSITR